VNKSELIDALADKLGVGKREAQHTVDTVLDTITRAVVAGEKVAITGFGIFEKVERGARVARNPRTGATVRVRKTSVPKFRAGAELKAFVSGAKKLAKSVPGRPAAAAKAAAPATKAAPAKRAVVKKAAPAKRAVVKKAAPAKRAVVKKAAPAKRAVVKKVAPAKAAPAKATAKKAAPARKTAVRKAAPARKAPARRAAKKA
jgi:DNA-binding protein HU-beta